jgi:DNA-binding response OmpR family regulator
VILITGREQPEDIQAGYEAGANDYLMKPCDLKYLRRRITAVAHKLSRKEAWLDKSESTESLGLAAMNPLDIYLSDLRLMRPKT